RHDFAVKHSLSDERMKYIITQLRIAGVLDGCSVLIDKQWELHSVFKSINSEKDFFLSRIQSGIGSVVTAIEDQIKIEVDPDVISVLESIKANAEIGIQTNYLKTKLLALRDYADQNEIDEVQSQISALSSQGSIIDIFEEDGVMQRFDEFESYFMNATSAKTWNASHQRIDISQESFGNFHINGQFREVPFLADNGVEVYFYPSFAAIYRRNSDSQAFQLVTYLSIRSTSSSFTERPSSWFNESDAMAAYRTWLHSRVNGGPDLRYKNNPSTPHYSFYKVAISPIEIEILSGSSSIIDDIKKAFAIIKPQLSVSRDVTPCRRTTHIWHETNLEYSNTT
ncbi:MAG: hypothetical protein J6N54_01300, partial [Bacteroidales bacterium]|nr:hypothetical protein [Bacteroidales bacterium]